MKIKAKDVKAILWILREIITLLLKLKKEDKNNGKKHLDGEGDWHPEDVSKYPERIQKQ